MLGGCFYSFCWHSGYCIFYSAYVVPTGFWIDCKSKLQKAGIPWKFRIYGRFGCNTHKGCNSSMVYGNLHIALPSPPGRGGGVPSWKTLNMWKKLSPCNATFVWRPSTGRSGYVNIRIYIYIHVIYRPLERSLKVNSSWITKYTWISDGSYQILFFPFTLLVFREWDMANMGLTGWLDQEGWKVSVYYIIAILLPQVSWKENNSPRIQRTEPWHGKSPFLNTTQMG